MFDITKEYAVFGSGKGARLFCRYVKEKYNINIEKYIGFDELDIDGYCRVSDLDTHFADKNIYIFIYVYDIEKAVYELGKKGYNNWICADDVLQEFADRNFNKNIEIKDFGIWADCFRRIQNFKLYKNPNIMEISRIDFMITERCSLKCQDCLNLMQYYKKPCDFKSGDLYKTIDMLDSVFDYIYDFSILGGEPFMNPDIYEIIGYASKKKHIGYVGIYTNATIPLDKDKLGSLNKDKVYFYISDYGIQKQISEDYGKILNESGIHHTIMDFKNDKWIAAGKIVYHDYTEEVLEKLYKNCMGKICPTILNNRFYQCEFIANADNLGAIKKDKENYVEFTSDTDINKENIKKYQEKVKYLPGCRYCSRFNGNDVCVEAAIQLKEPLLYERIE